MSQRKYFGTDGIRGRVGEWPITAEFMLRLGRAAGVALAGRSERPTVVIGKDTRVSGYMFESALEAGLVAAGADVRLLGPMPTPAVAFLTRTLRADAGIVISASHNPHQDNGVKFFSADGEKLDNDVESAIEREVDAAFTTVPSERLGKARRVVDAEARYAEFCKGTVGDDFHLRGLRMVLDCAHGATYQVAPKIFGELGADIHVIGAQPDGFNINDGIGCTHPEVLRAAVLERGADIGIAFDGDGDRVQMIDRQGALVDGDDMLYVLARHWQAQGRLQGPLVGTLMSNYGFEQAMARMGVDFIRTDVGDRHVLRALKAGSGVLGGETSGHILCLDRATTGDGIVAALAVLEALRERNEDLVAARVGLAKVPQLMLNVPLASGAAAVLETDAVREAVAAARRRLHGHGRVFLRPSGTEPLVRVTVEGTDADEVRDVAHHLADIVRSSHSRS